MQTPMRQRCTLRPPASSRAPADKLVCGCSEKSNRSIPSPTKRVFQCLCLHSTELLHFVRPLEDASLSPFSHKNAAPDESPISKIPRCSPTTGWGRRARDDAARDLSQLCPFVLDAPIGRRAVDRGYVPGTPMLQHCTLRPMLPFGSSGLGNWSPEQGVRGYYLKMAEGVADGGDCGS